MHMVIRVIVEADSVGDAVEKADDALGSLCGDGKPFDYYYTFDSRDGIGVPAAAKADSEAGKKLIRDAMKLTNDTFLFNLKSVREALLCFTDEEVLDQRIIDDKTKMLEALTDDKESLASKLFLARHRMWQCGEDQGPSVWLYTHEGEGIKNEADLKDCLDEIKEDRAWVVPADVHN